MDGLQRAGPPPRSGPPQAVSIQADYLVVGAGAGGMAFTDTLLSTDPAATVVLVDRRDQPGGHWVDAYPFVKLHQPANFYGVESRRLEPAGPSSRADLLHNLSSKPELLSYYAAVLQGFIATGRVRWFPSCAASADWRQSRRFESLVRPGLSWVCGPRTRCVDASYSAVTVPATSRPRFDVAPGAAPVVPINALGDLGAWRGAGHAGAVRQFVVVGAGKTGIDAVLWLRSRHVEPQRIRWIVPRDSWLFDRAFTLGVRGVGLTRLLDALQGMSRARTLHDYYAEMVAVGMLFPLDPQHPPERNRGAQVTPADVATLRTLVDTPGTVVRLGRVHRVEPGRILLERGELGLPPDGALLIDCTADGLTARPPQPVFQDGTITLQALVTFLMPISAAIIARVEASFAGDARKNALCTPVPHPVTPRDFLVCTELGAQNRRRWKREPALAQWYRSCRLNWRDAHQPSMFALVPQLCREWRRLSLLPTLERRLQDAASAILDADGGGHQHSVTRARL